MGGGGHAKTKQRIPAKWIFGESNLLIFGVALKLKGLEAGPKTKNKSQFGTQIRSGEGK